MNKKSKKKLISKISLNGGISAGAKKVLRGFKVTKGDKEKDRKKLVKYDIEIL